MAALLGWAGAPACCQGCDVDPADLSANAFERLAALTGEGLRESVVLPDGAEPTAEWLRDAPLLEGAQRTPVAERTGGGQWEAVS